jgi:integrase
MGRKRKDGDPLGLAGTRIEFKHGAFYYRHRGTHKVEHLGSDLAHAKKRAALYNDPEGQYGCMAYWFGVFNVEFERQVKAGTRSARTLADYQGYAAADGPLVAAVGKLLPEQVTPHIVQNYLDENANLDPPRPTPANRERAFLSTCLSWLMRTGQAPALKANPCLRGAGVRRNPESKRDRYVTDAEYRATYDAGDRSVRLMMELVYRTLQRPEIDVLSWTPANIKLKDGGRVLRFRQGKTGTRLDIGLVGELDALVRAAVGEVPQLHQPIVHTLEGTAYTYDGISSNLKNAQARVRARHAKAGGPLANMPSFGFRDLKGKGATDMWLAGEPIERIQQLCGHKTKTTTEIYIKARWSETIAPNNAKVSG